MKRRATLRQAKQHGWTPKEEFKGDPTRWVDAETFVKRADEVMPLLRKKTEMQDREIADLKKQIKKANEFFSKSEERAYQRALADLKAQQRDAVAAGDTAAFDDIDKQIADLKKDLPEGEVTQEEALEAFHGWREANAWYDKGNLANASETEIEARIYADRMMEKHVAKTKDMKPEAYFAMIGEMVLEKYPTLTQKTPRQKPASDVAPPTGGRGGRGGKTFADLPAEAQRQCDKWVKSGLLKSREQYVKDYDWS